jgi:hypothetical protein
MVSEEDYFTLGQGQEKIVNEIPNQSVYASPDKNT